MKRKNNMKKIYRISFAVPLIFFGVMITYVFFRFPIEPTGEWITSWLVLLIPTFLGCFLLWITQTITIEDAYITRTVLLLKSKRQKVSDIVSVKEDVEGRNVYRFNSIKVIFKDGYSFHVFLIDTRGMKDFIARIRAVVPDVVDSSVDDYIKKPY